MDKTEAQGSKSGLAGAMEWLDKRFSGYRDLRISHVEVLCAEEFQFLVLLWLSRHVRTGQSAANGRLVDDELCPQR